MASDAAASVGSGEQPSRRKIDTGFGRIGMAIFVAVLIGGFGYAIASFLGDTAAVGEVIAGTAFTFLALALLIALGFEFVNGFHDTANAVATVIYTNSLKPVQAVVWSGVWNFLGVLLSSGAVAYSIIALLPVDLIINVGSSAGYAMIFALLLAAVLWNVATWYVGLPNSSSHTLIGAVLGVGVANQLLQRGSTAGTAGVDWSQAAKVLNGLWMAPLIGFAAAFILLTIARLAIRYPKLFEAPKGEETPPLAIRSLLVLTCTLVSFKHGSNDGQKGMGLLMLILIGVAPTAYALNRTLPVDTTPALVASANAAADAWGAQANGATMTMPQARDTLRAALQARDVASPSVPLALSTVSRDVAARVAATGSVAATPAAETTDLRRDLYLLHDTSKLVTKSDSAVTRLGGQAGVDAAKGFESQIESATQYIPVWVKVAVAIALGLGTMIGWKRIVITVGEKIGKSEMTYAMGATAELVTAATIQAADAFALPVSTTHILSSSVAGASVASGHGLQWVTIRNMATAWVLTLPAAMLLSGGLYWVFLRVFVG